MDASENHEIVLIRRAFLDAVNTAFMIRHFELKTDLGERTPQDLIFEATLASQMTSDINDMKDNRQRYGMLSIAEIFNKKDPKAIVPHEQCMRWFDDIAQNFIRDRKLEPTLRELGMAA